MKTVNKITDDRETCKAQLAQAYLDFVGIIDDLPHWLQLSSIMASNEDGDDVSFQKKSFWVQRCTIMVKFHCLKLVILQQFISSGLWDIIGLSDKPLAWSMKKTEMIQDFHQTMDDIPFIYHQVKGEPNVERIRHVGFILLEMIQNADNEIIRKRANSYLHDFKINVKKVYRIEGEDAAIAEFSSTATTIATAKSYQQDYIAYIRAENGKIALYREYFDGSRIVAAFTPNG